MSPDPFDLTLLGDNLSGTNANGPALPAKKTPQSFLGENSALVNLDNLIKPVNGPGNDNIFGVSTGLHLSHSSANPFSSETQPAKPNLFQTQTQVIMNALIFSFELYFENIYLTYFLMSISA